MNLNKARCLIAYFSRKGNNYVNGKIVNLTIGNAEVAAEMIKELTGSKIFHIKPLNTYPEDYTETAVVAKQELDTDARPQIIDHVKDIDSYEVIFLGYPNW